MLEPRRRSELILDEVRRRKTREQIVDVDEAKMKVVIFTLGDDLYAFSGTDVREILPLARIFYVPGSPAWVLGVINVRGEIESVIAINGFLDLPESARTPRSRIVLAATGDIRSGVLVDAIEDVVDVPVSSIVPPLGILDARRRELVTGQMQYRDRNVTLLDIGKVFTKISA